jgi:hypothetical protein
MEQSISQLFCFLIVLSTSLLTVDLLRFSCRIMSALVDPEADKDRAWHTTESGIVVFQILRFLETMSAMLSLGVPKKRCLGLKQHGLSQEWQIYMPSGIGPIVLSYANRDTVTCLPSPLKFMWPYPLLYLAKGHSIHSSVMRVIDDIKKRCAFPAPVWVKDMEQLLEQNFVFLDRYLGTCLVDPHLKHTIGTSMRKSSFLLTERSFAATSSAHSISLGVS